MELRGARAISYPSRTAGLESSSSPSGAPQIPQIPCSLLPLFSLVEVIIVAIFFAPCLSKPCAEWKTGFPPGLDVPLGRAEVLGAQI